MRKLIIFVLRKTNNSMFKIRLSLPIRINQNTVYEYAEGEFKLGANVINEINNKPYISDSIELENHILRCFGSNFTRLAQRNTMYNRLTQVGLKPSPLRFNLLTTDRIETFDAVYCEETNPFLLLKTIGSTLVCAHLPSDPFEAKNLNEVFRTFTIDLTESLEISEMQMIA